MKTGARTVRVRVKTNGTCEEVSQVMGPFRTFGFQWTYQHCLMLGRVYTAHIATNFDGSTNNDGRKEPSAVFDPSEVCDGNEQEAINDAADHREREGRAVSPDAITIGHFVVEAAGEWSEGDWTKRAKTVVFD